MPETETKQTKPVRELTAEDIFSMDDDEFMAMWAEWESRDTLALQENLNSKEEWL